MICCGLAWSCGSIMSGQRALLHTIEPFSVDTCRWYTEELSESVPANEPYEAGG
jgi:hypothetical protein